MSLGSSDNFKPAPDSAGGAGYGTEVPETGSGAVPAWLIIVAAVAVFWAGAYLFSFSGGFSYGVFDYQPKFGVQSGGAAAAPDPKAVGKKLFAANCITCHQANGQGQAGQFPALAGSEYVLGPASNHLIAIVLKGLQGPVKVKGQDYNNAMQPWEGQYSDQQLAAILTYVRSDWGNNAPPINADMVKQMRTELKDRKDQWTIADLEKVPAKDLAGGAPPAGGDAKKANAPAPGQSPPAKQ